jgi:hypothetical protein
VFRWDGQYYMIPESYQAGSVRLYRAEQFPTRWSLVGTLLEGPYLVDSSILYFEGRWWLFTETSLEMRHDTLRLYHADDLLGPWIEHRHSPIKVGDAQTARPAGRALIVDGKPIRLAQNCCPNYGTDVRAFEITELTAASYREREVVNNPILRPGSSGWNRDGMHHIDAHRLEDGRWLACVDGWWMEEQR